MSEFIKLPSSIVNLSQIRQITFDGDILAVHWAGGDRLVLRGADAACLIEILECRYQVFSDSRAGYYLDEDNPASLDHIFTTAR